MHIIIYISYISYKVVPPSYVANLFNITPISLGLIVDIVWSIVTYYSWLVVTYPSWTMMEFVNGFRMTYEMDRGWLVVLTILKKKYSQWEGLPHILWKIIQPCLKPPTRWRFRWFLRYQPMKKGWFMMTGWWLSFTPPEKYEFVRLDHHPNSWGK